MNKFETKRWIPDGADMIRRPELNNAVVYSYPINGDRVGAVGYVGRAVKPRFNYTYRTPERRKAHITEFFTDLKATLEFKAEQAAKYRQRGLDMLASLQVGSILYASWGYEQTNIDFFQVTAIGKKSIKLRPISKARKPSGVWCSDWVTPIPGRFTGEETRHIITGPSVRIDDVRSAGLWDGKPKNETSYA